MPALATTARISGDAIGQWVRRYNESGITRRVEPPARVRDVASTMRCLVASDLRRARESAAWLASSRQFLVDPDLREAALPESLGIAFRLSPAAWAAVARVAWWLNWCDSDETVAMTRGRAARAADRLEKLAEEHGSVMAVGHGMFNRFVASQLRRRGWIGPKVLPSAHWSAAQFDQREPPALVTD